MRNVATNPDEGTKPAAPAARERLARHAYRGAVSNFLRDYTVVVVLVVLFVLFSLLKSETFFTTQNIRTMLTTNATLIILSLGIAVVLSTGGIDLSVGGTLGFSAVLIAHLSVVVGLPTIVVLSATLICAIAVGLINAFLVIRIGVNSLITTLAMGTLLTGISETLDNNQTISGLPKSILDAVQTNALFGVDLAFWYALIITVVLWYVMDHTPVGRHMYFTGAGRESARLAGIRTSRIRIWGYVISAAAAWLAALVLIGQANAAQPGLGNPYMLPGYAAAFLGAATIRPGRFNPLGTLVSVLLLAVGTTGFQLFGLGTWITDVFDGAILIIAVSFATIVGRTAVSVVP